MPNIAKTFRKVQKCVVCQFLFLRQIYILVQELVVYIHIQNPAAPIYISQETPILVCSLVPLHHRSITLHQYSTTLRSHIYMITLYETSNLLLLLLYNLSVVAKQTKKPLKQRINHLNHKQLW